MARPNEEHDGNVKDRSRFSPWDILVGLILVIIVIGMLIPSLQRIRDRGGNRAKCSNNLRQIGLATLFAHDMAKRLPPAFGSYNDKPKSGIGEKAPGTYPATIFYHLLPNLDGTGIYSRLPPLFNYPSENEYVLAPNPPLLGQRSPDENAAAFRMSTFICPSNVSGDPSGVESHSLIQGKAEASLWGTNGYAANYLLFGLVKEPRLPESVPDGLSTTIFFTEKAPICADSATGRTGGNLWAVPPFFPSDPQALVNYGGTFGYDPAAGNPTRPYSVALFQVEPAADKCDSSLAQSPHSGGINVSMGDGSARFISNTVSSKTWSALLTPYPIRGIGSPADGARSDVPGDDWQ